MSLRISSTTRRDHVTHAAQFEPQPAIELEFEKTGYNAATGLALHIAPGEHDKVELLVSAPRTSPHRFRLLVRYNDGQEGVLRSPLIDLHYFAPQPFAP